MTRVLLRWAVLAPAMWLSVASVLWFGFRTIDVRFEVFAALVVVPVVQALALTWAIRGRPQALRRLVPEIGRLPFGSMAAIVDAGMLVAGLVFWGRARIGFGTPGSLQIIWAATKAVAAGIFLLRRPSSPVRLAAGSAAIAIGLAGVAGWLGELPAIVAGVIGRAPLVLVYLGTYGTALVLLVALLLRLGRTWPATSVARLLVDGSVAAVLTASLVLVLNGFKYRVPMEPYRAMALLAASLAASAVLLAAEMPESSE